MNLFRVRPAKNKLVAVELKGTAAHPTEPALLIEYWAQQQNRVAQHEAGRYQFSSILIAGSLVALGSVGDGTMTAFGKWLACLAVLAVNLVAYAFTVNELRWIKVHQSRAKATLELMSPDIVAMQRQVNEQWHVRAKSDDNHRRFTASAALQFLHLLIAVICLVMAVAAPVATVR